MYIKQLTIPCMIMLVLLSCNKKAPRDFSQLKESEKADLAEYYHQVSNYFRQPSELYRTYKDSALMVQPNNVDLRQRLSYSYKKVGEHIKAMEVLNKAVDIDVANGKSDVLEYRAWTLLYYYHDYEGAVRDIDLIEKITGNPYNVCWGEPCGFHKGQALYKLGDFEEAIEAFKTVNAEEEKLGFDSSDNYMNFFYIGRCYTEMEDYENAIKFYEKSLTAIEQFPEAYYHLGLIYKKSNNLVKANENFELAKKYISYGISEPYVERFDEVFLYMIEKELRID